MARRFRLICYDGPDEHIEETIALSLNGSCLIGRTRFTAVEVQQKQLTWGAVDAIKAAEQRDDAVWKARRIDSTNKVAGDA